MKYTPIPYKINGVTLWAVEKCDNFIARYCDTKEQAQKHCDRLNKVK